MGKNNGKRTEQNFQKSCEKDGVLCIRLVDSNKFDFGKQSRFTPTNIADFICHDGCSLLIIELKSTVGTSISFNQPVEVQPKDKVKPSIKSHQVKSLLERAVYKNVYCGLLLDFDDRINSKGDILEGGTYYIDIHTFVGWTRSVAKKSINQNDAELIGIKVDRTKLKTNYKYDIKQLLEDIKNEDIFNGD